jgi:hypothetical protein
MDGEPEPDSPAYSRIYVRSLTDASHGNGIGIGLADYAHRDAVEALELTDTYVNAITSGEPVRARLPLVMPSDEAALTAAYSAVGVDDPAGMRIARIRNTLDLDRFWLSEPVLEEVRDEPGVTVGEPEQLTFADGDIA